MNTTQRSAVWAEGGRLALLLAIVVAVTFAYVSSEHIFYWSDYSGYQNLTHEIAADYRSSPLTAARAVARSMLQDYNALFTLPLLPFVLLLGDSRIVFEIALAVVYLLPFMLVLGLIAIKLIPGPPRAVFYSTVVLALLTPFTWVPTLRGYPDTGAACLVALAVWTFVQDTRLARRWQMPIIGVLLALAMLFRRHFAYDAIAFFAAMTGMAFWRFALERRQQPHTAWRELRLSGLRIGLAALAMLICLFTVGLPFTYHVLTQDVTALYASYEVPVSRSLQWYVTIYGWVICMAAVVGYVIGLFVRSIRREPVVFIVLFAGLLLVEWILLVRQLGEHYTLHFTPSMVWGPAILGWTVWRNAGRRLRVMAAGAGGLYLLANLAVGLTPLVIGTGFGAGPLFAVKSPPLTRPDYDNVAQLIDYLRGLTAGGQPIYVAASSDILNKDLVINAERILYGWDQSRLHVLQSPHIDSRDFYPLETLLQAQFVVVVEPFQQQLDNDQQRVVRVVYDLLTQQREIGQEFVKLPPVFVLENGAFAAVYRRIRPTPLSTAMRTLRLIQSYVPQRPGGQLDWMILSPAYPAYVEENRDGTYTVVTPLPVIDDSATPTLLYLGELPKTRTLRGHLTPGGARCMGLSLVISSIDEHDQAMDLARIVYRPGDAAEFSLAIPGQGGATLLVKLGRLDGESGPQDCSLTIDRLGLFD